MTRVKEQVTMPEEALIKAVKAHDVLYDKANRGYKNKILKQEAWDNIGAIVGLDVDYCQQRWRSLRDRFVKEIAKNSTSSSASEESKWIHLDSMEFIRTHVAPRKTFRKMKHEFYAISPYTIEDSTNADMSLDVDLGRDSKRIFSFEDENFEECDMSAHKKRHTDTDIRGKDSGRISSFEDEHSDEGDMPAHKKRRLAEISTRIDQLVGVVENILKEKPDVNSESSASSHSEFFAMLEKMFNKLPEEKKERVKYKIYTLLYEELEQPIF